MIYKMFDIRGTKNQQDLTVEAINDSSFPWDLIVPGLRERFGMSLVPITWDNNMSTKTLGELSFKKDFAGKLLKNSLTVKMNAKYFDYYGLDPYYLPPYPKKLGVVPDPGMWFDEDTEDTNLLDPPGRTWEDRANQPNSMRQVMAHELGHVVDVTYVDGPMRRRIYNAFHGHLTTDVPPHGHAVIFRDPAHKDYPQDVTATLENDKIVNPQKYMDRDGNFVLPPTPPDDPPRLTIVPGAPVPGVPGREKGFMRADIINFNDIDSWLTPQPDPNAQWPITKAASYPYRVAESFAEAFAQTYWDYPGGGGGYVHNPDDVGIQQIIARTLTPWMLELYRNDQAAGGSGGQEGETVTGLPPYITPESPGVGAGYIPPGHTYYWPLPLEPMPPTDPVGWTPTPGTGTINGFYATQKEKRFHNAHKNYAPEGAIIYPTREAAVESGKVPCPRCQP